MRDVNAELKKVVDRVKTAQGRLQGVLKDRTWVEEARKYADKQKKEVQKLLSGDVHMVKTFIEKERQELEKFQKQIPGEIKKFKKFVDTQKKELEKLLTNVRKTGLKAAKTKTGTRKSKAGGTKKKTGSTESSSSLS
ncbi:hypothetical protein K2X30_06515 [bacterium]|nr:hypothetical protein [bacterium]